MKQVTLLFFRSLILILFLSLSYSSYGQNRHSKQQLREDLDILKYNLEKTHPGLYTYSSKGKINNWFENAKNALKDSSTVHDFYRIVAPLNSIIKNGHTNVNYPNFGKNFNILPIRIYKYKNSFHIVESFTKEYENLIGEEIDEINGVAIKKIFDTLLENRTRDGENLTFPSDKLMYYFSLDYALKFQYGEKTKHTLKLAKREDPISLQSVVLSKDLIARCYEGYSTFDNLYFKIKDSIAVLRVPVFEKSMLRKNKYRKTLKEAFKKIKNNHINHLVIDVRNNLGGGTSPTQELISYIYDKEFKLHKEIYTIDNKIRDRKYYKKQGVFWTNLFIWTKLKKIKDNYYQLNDPGLDVVAPKKNNYKGKLYILTNGTSFSATGEFTSFIKEYREAIFIGEEVGGNRYQNTSGEDFMITLPNSKLRVDIPVVLWIMNSKTKNSGHGVIPDHWIRNTVQDELEGRDSAMKFTFQLIKNSDNSRDMQSSF